VKRKEERTRIIEQHHLRERERRLHAHRKLGVVKHRSDRTEVDIEVLSDLPGSARA
jgi:hypothetical protein